MKNNRKLSNDEINEILKSEPAIQKAIDLEKSLAKDKNFMREYEKREKEIQNFMIKKEENQ